MIQQARVKYDQKLLASEHTMITI